MKKLILLLSMGILYANDISGNYIVTTVIENGKTKHPNAEVSFKSDGKYYMMGAPFGQWKSGKGDIVYLNSAFEPKFEKYTAIDNDKELILQNQKGKLVYKKVDTKKASKQGAMIVGSWEKVGKNSKKVITFKQNGDFSCLEIDRVENTQTKGSGTWIVQNQKVIITAFGCEANGKHSFKKRANTLLLGEQKYIKVK